MTTSNNLSLQIQALLAEDRLNELGPGKPNTSVRAQLEQLESELLASPNVRDRDFASACLAGLWLYHDFLDESHTISQDLHTVEGSYWHAIMHRREPDAWNSKYWFRRFSGHPIFADLRDTAETLAKELGMPERAEFLLRQKTWAPAAFVDLCELGVRETDTLNLLCRKIQRREWDLLFQFCLERAC